MTPSFFSLELLGKKKKKKSQTPRVSSLPMQLRSIFHEKTKTDVYLQEGLVEESWRRC